MLTLDQLRQAYLDFFVEHGHAVVPSAPLIPENDPTTLFVSSGMQPLIRHFLGEPHPLGSRIVNAQKCFRSQDIEDVGDNRHTTFFEMLGNWSFGDYFKSDQLPWVWQFVTQVVGLDPNKLLVSVFGGDSKLDVQRDEETILIWQKLFSAAGLSATVANDPSATGMGSARIAVYTWANWWSRAGDPRSMPIGEPGGPDSEIFYDFGAERLLHEQSSWADQPCHVACDCGRYLEIGNSVFMQFVKTADGLAELPSKNVDFGGGLERLLAAHFDNPDVFQLPVFAPMIAHLEKLTKLKYGATTASQKSFRVITDHVRSAVMLMADGAAPSNKDSGYVVRRLLRRAARHGRNLGCDQPFLADLVPLVLDQYRVAYPELNQVAEHIATQVAQEEQKFGRTLARGERQLGKLLEQVPVTQSPSLTPELAFTLYETFGFPLELTVEAVLEQRPSDTEISSDQFRQQFDQIRQHHAQQSRSLSAGAFKGGLQDQSERTTRFHTATHLLHAALRLVLGDSVQQKGSHITAERLRFDFTFERALTPLELQRVADQVNAWITADLPVHRQELPKATALQQGALAFFVEKYPDVVSVYTVGSSPDTDWVSKELCGGPHVTHTAIIGPLKIDKEQSVAAGVRRIYMSFVETA